MRIGIICPSEIALRRFMPALQLVDGIHFAGIGVNTKAERYGTEPVDDTTVHDMLAIERGKAQAFTEQYGGKIYNSYEEIIKSDEIDAVYIPLPPALHFKWTKLALENGKHVLVEKPATLNHQDTAELIQIAKFRNLALHENYMFIFHDQLDALDNIISSGRIGDVRLYRVSFGFPMRISSDFRYKKVLGGGALFDAGGYTIKYAAHLLGSTTKVVYAQMNYIDDFEVDMYGSAALVNDRGVTAQIAFGMDNNYKCELEVWGSKSCLTTGRVLTAPAGFIPSVNIRNGNKDVIEKLPEDDAFKKSIEYFIECTLNSKVREENYEVLSKQASMVDEFRFKAERDLQKS